MESRYNVTIASPTLPTRARKKMQQTVLPRFVRDCRSLRRPAVLSALWLSCLLACTVSHGEDLSAGPISSDQQARVDIGTQALLALRANQFRERVQPILETYCYSCHGNGASEGNRAFDEFKSDEELVNDVELWWAVLKNVRTRLMPPAGEEQLNDDERRQLFDWIKFAPLGIDPANLDPGRVTLRRLNRVEYRNTIRDLTGVDYNTMENFPADDTGYGFDTVGDALSMSPLLMEKYLAAAEQIVAEAVPGLPPDEHSEIEPERRERQGKQYARFFPKGPAPAEAAERDAYARECIATFAKRAYRRPADEPTLDQLVAIARHTYTQPNQSFEAGVATAYVAVLASPRFLFRVEGVSDENERFPFVDEYALAARLSYFLWSTTPDDELMQLADAGQLRANLPAQVSRMLKHNRSEALVKNFAGQWLRSRDVEHTVIDPIAALGMKSEFDRVRNDFRRLRDGRRGRRRDRDEPEQRDDKAADEAGQARQAEEQKRREQERERISAEFRRFTAIRESFDGELRRAMRRETEMYFEHILREDRSLLELIDSSYTFLNARLAEHYDIAGVEGNEIRRVELPADSPRGGLLSQGTLLVVTSNPTRTSPVKRGLYILDNVLGTPAPPPPAAVPPLERSADAVKDHEPTVRELMELHSRDPLCHSCHARMDPLGLALENFNALGQWRETENGRPIDAAGTLLTGEEFDGFERLKQILTGPHRLDFYRCLAEKLLTYALGRGLEYYDEHTVDQIVDQLDREEGKFSALVLGIIESAPFQRQRRPL